MTETKPSLAVRRALRRVSTAAKNKHQAERAAATAARADHARGAVCIPQPVYQRYDVACRRLDMAIEQYHAAKSAEQEDK